MAAKAEEELKVVADVVGPESAQGPKKLAESLGEESRNRRAFFKSIQRQIRFSSNEKLVRLRILSSP